MLFMAFALSITNNFDKRLRVEVSKQREYLPKGLKRLSFANQNHSFCCRKVMLLLLGRCGFARRFVAFSTSKDIILDFNKTSFGEGKTKSNCTINVMCDLTFSHTAVYSCALKMAIFRRFFLLG